MKIDIITSVVDGLAEVPVLKINGKIVNDFDWFNFDWDAYDFAKVAWNGQSEVTQEQAKKLHSKLIKEEKRDDLVHKIVTLRNDWSEEEMIESGYNNTGHMVSHLSRMPVKDLEEILSIAEENKKLIEDNYNWAAKEAEKIKDKQMKKITIPICFYEDENGNKVYDFETMANEFENELNNLTNCVVMCSIEETK